jgi:hypothetical protein
MKHARAPGLVLSALLVAVALAGCAKQDGSVILGQWHAERFDVMGVKLPISPDLAISRNALSMSGSELPVTKIEQDGDQVVLDTAGDIGLTFHMVDADRMYVEFPILDRIYYRRVKTHVPLPPASPPPPAAAVVVAAAPVPAPVPAAPAYAQAYAAAVQAAGQGRHDVALRHLHQAVREGFDRPDQLQHEPAFAPLQSDPRYQVIALNIAKR